MVELSKNTTSLSSRTVAPDVFVKEADRRAVRITNILRATIVYCRDVYRVVAFEDLDYRENQDRMNDSQITALSTITPVTNVFVEVLVCKYCRLLNDCTFARKALSFLLKR